MRKAFIASLAVLGVVATGCGGSESNPQVDAITHTYNIYIAAVLRGDGKLACRQLTPAYRRKAELQVPPSIQGKLRGAPCPKVIRVGVPRALLKGFRPNLTDVAIDGDNASGTDPGVGVFAPQKILFRRLGGKWKVAGTVAENGRLVS